MKRAAPAGWEYGCESCDFHTEDEQAAFDHCDEQRHSLALRPLDDPPLDVDLYELL